MASIRASPDTATDLSMAAPDAILVSMEVGSALLPEPPQEARNKTAASTVETGLRPVDWTHKG